MAWTVRLAPVTWIAVGWSLEHAGYVIFARFVFPLIFAVAFFPAYFQLFWFRCPRCRQWFFGPGRVRLVRLLSAMFFFQRCNSCGVRVGEPIDDAK